MTCKKTIVKNMKFRILMQKMVVQQKLLLHFIYIYFLLHDKKVLKLIFKKFNFFTKGKIRKGMECMI